MSSRAGLCPQERTFRGRLDRLPRPGASAPDDAPTAEAVAAPVLAGSSDADLARALRVLVERAVEAIATEATKRPRSAATRTLRDIAPLTQALESLWRVEDAVKQRSPQPKESDRSLNELRDDLYNRLVHLQASTIAEREGREAEHGDYVHIDWDRPRSKADNAETGG